MRPARILVIDDSVSDINLLRLAFDLEGEEYVLECLSNGEAALQFVRENRSGSREQEPCVILLDLYLPKHNGLEVLSAIKETPAMAHINVVVLTGSISSSAEKEVQELGGIYRRKPLTLSEFAVLTREILAICKGTLSVSS